ncbi:MAG: MoxR family ATPase [Gammaproteobacteria bacterium]|nr:MoxR family ATPase [Gammaproteobacteria bacterium]
MSAYPRVAEFVEALNTKLLGQQRLVERLVLALIAEGHVLIEGAPGLAKTRAVRELANKMQASFKRVQFTPDLMPADLTGSDVFRPQTGDFQFQAGPLFHQLILADEINRAQAKVHSALLEAMAEKQITVGQHTYQLPKPFVVIATQNPLENEGTYALPEAQLDRFLLHVTVDYPDAALEKDILQLVRGEAANQQPDDGRGMISPIEIQAAQKEVQQVKVSAAVEDYMIRLVMGTREGGVLAPLLEAGVSPRGTIALDQCSRGHAWLRGRDYVLPDDVQAVAPDVLRHRMLLSLKAQASGISREQLVQSLLDQVSAV